MCRALRRRRLPPPRSPGRGAGGRIVVGNGPTTTYRCRPGRFLCPLASRRGGLSPAPAANCSLLAPNSASPRHHDLPHPAHIPRPSRSTPPAPAPAHHSPRRRVGRTRQRAGGAIAPRPLSRLSREGYSITSFRVTLVAPASSFTTYTPAFRPLTSRLKAPFKPAATTSWVVTARPATSSKVMVAGPAFGRA